MRVPITGHAARMVKKVQHIKASVVLYQAILARKAMGCLVASALPLNISSLGRQNQGRICCSWIF